MKLYSLFNIQQYHRHKTYTVHVWQLALYQHTSVLVHVVSLNKNHNININKWQICFLIAWINITILKNLNINSYARRKNEIWQLNHNTMIKGCVTIKQLYSQEIAFTIYVWQKGNVSFLSYLVLCICKFHMKWAVVHSCSLQDNFISLCCPKSFDYSQHFHVLKHIFKCTVTCRHLVLL